jgi:hypothetical protein
VRAQVREATDRLRAARNVSTLVTVLERSAEALAAAGDAQAAVACLDERRRLLEALRLPAAEFWPQVPAGGATSGSTPPPAPREYWAQRTTDGTGSDPLAYARASRGGGDETIDAGAGASRERGTSLMDSLGAIEGFLPRF